MRIPSKTEIDAEFYRRNFYEFVKASWQEVDPSPFIDSTYIKVICSHLEWVYRTGNDLVINIPPRHAKSILVSVMFHPWVWTHDPSKSFLCATHSSDLTLRDSQKARQLVKSNWYVKHFGDVGFLPDQDVKSRFVNKDKGSRQSVSVSGGVTGDGADIRIVDDALDASNADNEDQLKKVNEWNDTTFSTRVKSPKYKPQITVMQRLSPNDLSGHLIERGTNILCLPAEYDPEHPIKSNTPPEAYPDGMDGDWRTYKGQVLFPEQYDEQAVRESKLKLGGKASGQLNQYPKSQEGDLVKEILFEEYSARECGIFEELIITADTAEKEGDHNAYSVFALYGKKGNNIYVLDVARGKYDILKLFTFASSFWNKHNGKRPNSNPSFRQFLIEDKSSGGNLMTIMRDKGYGVSPIIRDKDQ